ncbi:MAG: heme-copper oxidase subunit III [Candidatus Rokubacteria bacterium]|nr:heme-copper oxidase subunit III [Candidatus Rokubacteria bacterium]
MTPAILKPPARDDAGIVDELLAEIGRIPPAPPPGDGGDGERPFGEPERTPFVPNAVLGMLVFLGAETMLFAGLIAGFLVLRYGAVVWPPPFQPRLPVEVTGVNTAVLLLSSLTMARALRAIRRGKQAELARGLALTAVLGAIFLAVQGSEWVRLVQFGLTVASGAYGATFYTLIGTHAVHVLGALRWSGFRLF